METEWEPLLHKTVKCTLDPRPVFKQLKLKPGVAVLKGREATLRVCWKMGVADKYPNEYALTPADPETAALFNSIELNWISSGDVVFKGIFNRKA